MFADCVRLPIGLLTLALAVPPWTASAQPAGRTASRAGGLETRQLAPLVKAVDRLAAVANAPADGEVVAFEWQEKAATLTGPTPGGLVLSWQHASLKSADRKIYVPFVVGAAPKALPATSAAAYVRVVGATGAAVYENDFVGEFRGAGGQPESRLARAVSLPAGEYVVYLALRFDRSRAPRPAPSADVSPTADPAPTAAPGDVVYVFRKELKIEELWSEDLTTSTVFVADRLEALKAPLTPQLLADRPFVIGAAEILPAFDRTFRKTEELTVFFQVYNAVLGSDQKPNVSVDYVFERVDGESLVAFKRVPTQSFNAQTLPPNYDAASGHQVSAGWAVPLASFPVGDYRLAVTIEDKLAGTSIARYVTFTVAGS